MSSMLKALQAVKKHGYSPGKGKPRERLALINPLERRVLELLGGSGKITRAGVPSFSWRDNSSSANRSSTNDGNGGSRDAGGNVNGTGSGSGEGGRGGLTGQRGARVQSPIITPTALPIQPLMPPVVPPRPIMPVASPITPPPVYGAPPTGVDLNPATLAPWTGVGLDALARFRNPLGNYPAQYNGGGPALGRFKDQSRLSGMSRNRNGGNNGRSGGGFGGGGGGGW